jgi:hypothetical protein
MSKNTILSEVPNVVGIVKGVSGNNFVAATAGTDYLTTATATSLTSLTAIGNVTVGTYGSRINAISNTTASTATLTPDLSVANFYTVTAQAAAINIANPTGTPLEGQKLIIRLKDNGTARAITFGAQFRASADLPLPTTTVISKTMYMGFIYNITDVRWDMTAFLNNF